MRAVMPNGYCLNDNRTLNKADRAILNMRKYLDVQVPKEYERLLDVATSIYAASSGVFDMSLLCLRTEFCQQGGTVRRFKSRQRKFFEQLLTKRFVFRTPKFQQRYEAAAKENVTRAFKQVSD
jgi:predicted metal-dependent HD superfamily phosphohydrolase